MQVGLSDLIVAGRPRAETVTRLNYLGAAASRVDSFWVPDHLNALFPKALWQPQYCETAKITPSVDAYMEPWTMLGNLAARNRIGRLQLGVAVTDTGRRNPAVTAQAACTLNLLTRGRAVLGIGTGEREGNEPYGVDWSRPVARFEEAMATIRALWDSKGELLNRDSPYFPLRNAVFALPPYRGKWPPIWIAAHGPRMLRAVGKYGDGYFPAFLTEPREYALRLDAVRSAASDAGRDPMSIVPAVVLATLTASTSDLLDEALESEVVRAGALNIPDSAFAQHGATHPLGAGFGGAHDIMPQGWDEQTALSYAKGVPPEVVKHLGLIGTPDEIVEKAAQWRDCGVRHVVLLNVTFLQRSLRRSVEASVPFYKVVRMLKRL
ncbi:photosystem I reaction center subunit VIII [Mycobacterium sp. IS-1742]|uniref:LLM class flavin-dependent oxidoreductase n=1 Tax=Mycobacterium sp. IS-1742 TaxID=1772285 RepID=UPI00073FA8E8|nr:LLM class flavin-dependent oxidoreductase [Mycobacterium sp. IS-1742]KUI27681.1 photosystem I reaction center subunit VIII [Mycobacterium sp. IS-1742]